MSADPWEPPCSPSLLFNTARRADIVMLGGPDRFYDDTTADPSWRPRNVGFAPPQRLEVEPLLWEGDGA